MDRLTSVVSLQCLFNRNLNIITLIIQNSASHVLQIALQQAGTWCVNPSVHGACSLR